MNVAFFNQIIPDLNYSLFVIAGMAAVTSCVIGGPISTLLIVFELTSDYQVALGAGISVCFSNLISSKIYGHSAFDQMFSFFPLFLNCFPNTENVCFSFFLKFGHPGLRPPRKAQGKPHLKFYL